MTDKPFRIFVVEDHAIMREVYEELLGRQADFALCGSAISAEEALARLTVVECDLIVADVTLPGMDGIELVGELRRRGHPARIVLVSAHMEDAYAQRARDAGADQYLTKDNLVSALPQAIRQTLGGDPPS